MRKPLRIYWVCDSLEINWWKVNVMINVGALNSSFSRVSPFCSKGKHCPKKPYWLWVEFSYPFPLKFVETEILASLVLQLLLIELIFIQIDLNHMTLLKLMIFLFMKIWWICLMFSLKNWFLEGYFYEIEIYFLMMTWLWEEMRFALKLLMIWTRFGYDFALKLRFTNDDTLDQLIHDLKWFKLNWKELMIDFLKGIFRSSLRK